MNIGHAVADLMSSCARRRAFTADELGEFVGSRLDPAILESALSADPNLICLGADEPAHKWYASKSTLFAWFCHLNRRLARAEVFQLQCEQLAHAMSSLRIEGQWHTPPQGAVAFGEALGLVGHGVRPGHHVFPLARVLGSMPGFTLRAAVDALRQLARSQVWAMRLEELVGEYVQNGFADWDPRERAIVLRRTGLQTGTRMTLEEAGSPWRLTRERTRQLEERFWSRLKANAGVGRQRRRALVAAMLCDFMAHAGSLVIPIGSATWHLRAFLARCSFLPVGELPTLGFVVIAASLDELATLEVRRYPPGQYTEEAVAQILAVEAVPGLIEGDVAALARATAGYRRKHLRRPQRVYLALQAIGRPAHYSRIAEMHNSMFPERVSSEQNIHACLSREELGVVWVGARGTFALQEWGYERPSATLFESVADIVERKYEETGRPVPYSVVVAEIGKVRPIVNPTSLIYATSLNDRLQSVDGNCFVPRSGDEGGAEEPSAEELDRILRRFQEDTESLQSAAQESEASYAGLDH